MRILLVVLAIICGSFCSVQVFVGSEALMLSQFFSGVTTADGLTPLCATDAPSSIECATGRLRCASRCVLQPLCYHFNYIKSSNQCELFCNSPPVHYSILPECHGYQVQVSGFKLTSEAIVLYCIVLYLSISIAFLTASAFQKRSRPQQMTLCRSLQAEAL